MAVRRQRALPFYVDAQELQLLAVTGQVGGAEGVHTRTLRGGPALRAAVSDVIAVFFREENREREKVMFLINHFTKVYSMYFVNTCVLEELYFDIISNFYLLIMHFPCRPFGWSRVKGSC